MNKGAFIAEMTDMTALEMRVQAIAARQDSIILSVHAQQQMRAREIIIRDLVNLFRNGRIHENGRFQTTKHGDEIRFSMTYLNNDDQILQAVAVIAPRPNSNIYVITVFEVGENGNGEW
jgi:hypothetical protein